ncbi:MAG: polysaccharide biosynthesis tyrosine autokinase [Bacteroides sp.]|nr:polysaccharide biosynthesis tyrosine autokinase [Bacteroides sp.]
MEKKDNIASKAQKGSEFQFKDYAMACLAEWKWFVAAILLFVALGVFKAMRTQPVYTRSMSVLIQSDGNSGGLNVATVFQDFGLGGGNANVYNELISLKSPAVMFEVVKRLNLNINTTQLGFPRAKTLYGSNSPMEVISEVKPGAPGVIFEMTLRPDDSYVLENFHLITPDGEQKLKDAQVKGKLGFDPVKTPGGEFTFRPNGNYTNDRDEDVVIKVTRGSVQGAVENYIEKLKGDLASADAEVIELTIDDTSIQRATDILNTVVEVYNEFWVRDKNRMAVATSQFIDDRLKTLVAELADVDSDIADYQSQHHIPDLEQAARTFLDEQTSVSRSMMELNNQLAMAKYIRDYIANPANENQVVPVNTGMGSQALERLIADYNTLLLTRNNLLQNSSESNPVVEDYTTQVRGMRESLIKSVNAQVGALQANMKSLQSAEGQSQANLSSAPKQAQYLGSIKRDQAIKESLYLFLLQKREENNISMAFNAYNTRIITPPFGPMEPIAPRTKMSVIIGIVLGLFFPAVIIYFVKAMDNKVHSRKDMEDLPIPFTGEIPQVDSHHRVRNLFKSKKKRQKEIDTPKPIVAEGKRDVPNEAFRVVRSNIDLMMGDEASHPVLAVTSFNPGSGKSFVAFNLGASFALKKKRVLLIDGDLRHGSLSTYVSSPHRGLAAYLTGKETDPHRIIYPAKDTAGLSIVPIGKRPPNPAELLEGNRLGEFIDSVRQDYDIIMIDCPPVNVVVDTQLINRYADATIFVVRAGLLQRSAIADLVTLYNDKKLKRMSILLNGTEAAHSSYYTYGNYQSLEE